MSFKELLFRCAIVLFGPQVIIALAYIFPRLLWGRWTEVLAFVISAMSLVAWSASILFVSALLHDSWWREYKTYKDNEEQHRLLNRFQEE